MGDVAARILFVDITERLLKHSPPTPRSCLLVFFKRREVEVHSLIVAVFLDHF